MHVVAGCRNPQIGSRIIVLPNFRPNLGVVPACLRVAMLCATSQSGSGILYFGFPIPDHPMCRPLFSQGVASLLAVGIPQRAVCNLQTRRSSATDREARGPSALLL